MSRLVVKRHRPLESILAVILLNIILSVTVWAFLDKSHWDFIKHRLSNNEQFYLLWDANQTFETENVALAEKIIMLERSTQIDNQAMIKLQDDIRSLQDEVYQLKEELEFYQGVMSATADSKGLNVQGLHIVATDEERVFWFKLVLTNVAINDKVIEVKINMSVEGMNDTGTEVLAQKDIIADNDVLKREIKLKNFERIEGNFVFPQGFKPLRVIVDLQQKNLKKSRVKKVFEWPANAG